MARSRLPQQSRTIKLRHEEDLQEIFEFDIYYDEAKNRHVCRFFSQFSNKGGDTEQMVVEFPLSKLVQHEVSQMHKLITERLKRQTKEKTLSKLQRDEEILRLQTLLKEHAVDPLNKCTCLPCKLARTELNQLYSSRGSKSSRPTQ